MILVVPQIALNSTIHENDQQLAVLTIRKVRMLDSYHDSTCPPQKKLTGIHALSIYTPTNVNIVQSTPE